MKKIDRIIVHHSASEWGTALEIDRWHRQRGWRGIGYHFVVTNGIPTVDNYNAGRMFGSMVGQISYGRSLNADPWLDADEIGAHAYGYNQESVGICLIHAVGDTYDRRMIEALDQLLMDLMSLQMFDLDTTDIIGHYEIDPGKPDCPGLDMEQYRAHLFSLLTGEPGTTAVDLSELRAIE